MPRFCVSMGDFAVSDDTQTYGPEVLKAQEGCHVPLGKIHVLEKSHARIS